jgi:ABC-type Fe3+-siderophore transport system permease subunit
MKPNRLLLFLFAGTIVMIAVMRWHGAPLETPVSKMGVVSLELAKTTEQSNIILHQWKQDQVVEQAIINTYIDFIFLIFYSLFLYAVCWSYSLRQQPPWASVSRILAMTALLSGLCDVIENYFMLQMLEQQVTETRAYLSWLFASIKFMLLIPVVLWSLICLPLLFRRK